MEGYEQDTTTGAGDIAASFAEIADDHTALLALIDHIETMMVAPKPDRAVIVAALDDLVTLARDHFEYENALMGDSPLEEFERHRTDHRYLLRCLSDFTEAIRTGERSPSLEVAFDLDNWLNFHIQRFDAELHALLTA